MTPTPIRVDRARFIVASLATLALALAACGAASDAPAANPAPTASSAPIVTAAPVTASAAEAPGPQAIHLILHPVSDTTGSLVGCSNAARCQGDFMVGYDPVVDAATGKEVGAFAYECFLVDVGSTLYHCPGATITLTDRGQIVFTEVIEHEPGKPATVGPITGGTGEFLGATGTVTAKVLSGSGDFVISLTR